jgi:hypothetical protein
MKKQLTWVSVAITFSLLLLSGCMTANKATRQIANISRKQPIILADECGKRYPPTDSIWEKETFIQGETMVVTDTVTVDCDSAVKTLVRYVKVPFGSKVRIDTMIVTKFERQVNTAAIEAVTRKYNDLTVQRTKDRQARNIWMWIAIGLGAAWLLFIAKKLFL